MRALTSVHRHFVKKLKNIAPESWVEKPADAYVPFADRKIENLQVKYYRDVKKTLTSEMPTQQLKPTSPRMGPYTVENPKIYNKTYRWCSCGLSLNQPFCDTSHNTTAFKPLKFTIQQNVKQVDLCGCKLSTKKPFCDGVSCKPTESK